MHFILFLIMIVMCLIFYYVHIKYSKAKDLKFINDEFEQSKKYLNFRFLELNSIEIKKKFLETLAENQSRSWQLGSNVNITYSFEHPFKNVKIKNIFTFSFLGPKYLDIIFKKYNTDLKFLLITTKILNNYFDCLKRINDVEEEIKIISSNKESSNENNKKISNLKNYIISNYEILNKHEQFFIKTIGKIAKYDFDILNKSSVNDFNEFGEPLTEPLKQISS